MKIIKKEPLEIVEEVVVQIEQTVIKQPLEEEAVEMVAQIPTVEEIEETEKATVHEPTEETLEEDIKELEQQLDEALEEVAKEEILLNEMECHEVQVSNNQLYKTMLDINETLIIAKREELIVDNKIFRAIEKNIDVTTEVNNKYNKTTIAIIVTFFVLGMLIGMQDEKWLPYVGNILDFARTATNVVK